MLVPPEASGERLDAFLNHRLPGVVAMPLSRSDVRRLVMAGAVTVGGRIVRRPAHALEAGVAVRVSIDERRLPPARRGAPQRWVASRGDILFQDAWLIAVNKPPGLPVHATADTSRDDLVSAVRRYLSAGGDAYVAVHHRLDVETSGVVLLAIDAAANGGLARAFAGREIEKTYLAMTVRPRAPVPASWTARRMLAIVGHGRSAHTAVVERGGQDAETWFRVRARSRHALMIEAQPRTGRKHQIRAHLAAAGLPILGDARYGGPTTVAAAHVPRVMLHACRLRLDHPVTGEPLVVEAPLPLDWQDLAKALRFG